MKAEEEKAEKEATVVIPDEAVEEGISACAQALIFLVKSPQKWKSLFIGLSSLFSWEKAVF